MGRTASVLGLNMASAVTPFLSRGGTGMPGFALDGGLDFKNGEESICLNRNLSAVDSDYWLEGGSPTLIRCETVALFARGTMQAVRTLRESKEIANCNADG